MTEPSKLEQIVARCKCSVTVTVNFHTTNYQTLADCIRDEKHRGLFDEEDYAALARCLETGELWEVQAYVETHVGFINVVGSTMDEALSAMIGALDGRDEEALNDIEEAKQRRIELNARHCKNCTRIIGPKCPDDCSVLD